MKISEKTVIAVIGLGYVGLPLALEFARKYRTIGYDLSGEKIANYRRSIDPAGEVSAEEFKAAVNLSLTFEVSAIREADVIIVAVPTPVDTANIPDFAPLIEASAAIGKNIKRGAIVVFESTVYPGATEEVCIPVIEEHSGLTWKKDFNVGYSPERVNPGDKERTFTRIIKVVSGDNETTLSAICDLYRSVITAGVHPVSSIKVAEASKVIENTQRDLNIALMNELAIIFNRLGVDTTEVLEAAGTKWNFLPFRPGLVGGHCIGVDPYYLTFKAETLGYHPQVILAGRRINDGMAQYVAQQTVKQLIKASTTVKGAKVVVLGLAYKENCSDLRNTKVADLVMELSEYGCEVYVHDPVAAPNEAQHEYGLALHDWNDVPRCEAMVAAVSHKQFLQMPLDGLLSKLQPGGLFVDVKSAYPAKELQSRGVNVWRV